MRNRVDPKWQSIRNILIILVLSMLIIHAGADYHVVLAQNPTIQGVVYYVAPTGNDSAPGTFDQPWKTIQKAAQTMIAGDTVIIRGGTYYEQVVPLNSGSPGGMITYAAYPGETPVLDGTGVALPDTLVGLFEVSGKSYIHITGLRVQNVVTLSNENNGGIIIRRSSHITVDQVSTHNTISSGIGVWDSQNITIDSNRVELANRYSSSQECLTMAGTSAFQISNNEVVDCNDEGINVKDGSSDGKVYKNHVHQTLSTGIYIDAYAHRTYNIAVFQNLIHDSTNDNGIALGSEKGGLLEEVHIYNNIIYHNRFCGILLSTAGDGNNLDQHPMKNIRITNNTIYNNGWTKYGGGILVDNPDAQGTIIRNNLVSQNLSYQIAIDSTVPRQQVTVDHNLIDGYRGYEGETYGTDFVSGNPLFINPIMANFDLQTGSPAIDAGSQDSAPDDDFADNPRPQGAGVDIGAYETPGASKTANPSAARKGEIITYTIKFTGTGSPVTVTDTLPFQVSYQSSSLNCPGTVTYDKATRELQYSGTPASGQVCTIHIVVLVDTDERMAVSNSATIDNGQPPIVNVTAMVILNGLMLYLPLIFKAG